MSWLVALGVSAAALALSYELGSSEGLFGSALGVGFAVILCVVCHLCVLVARRVSVGALSSVMMSAAFISFVLMATFTLVVGFLRPSCVSYAAVSAFAIYFVFRIFEAIEVSRVERKAS